MNWHGNRFGEEYTYVKVSPYDWTEQGTYDYITSGSIEMSDDNKYKVTGSFQFNGPVLPDPGMFLRVYYSFYDDEGEIADELLATLYTSYSSVQYNDSSQGTLYSGTLNGSSILQILDDKKYGQPFIIKKNSNAIYKAFEIIEEFGLRVDYTPSSKVISTDHTFGGDNSYLDIVTWLCDFAGYRQPFVSSEGIIQLQPIVKPEDQKDPLVFRDDSQSIMYPEVDSDNDWQTKANVVKKIYNTDRAWAIATAKNIRGSKMSLENVPWHEITLIDEISDVDNGKNILTQLLDKAEKDLREEANESEYVTFSHAYVPIELKKAVKIEYSDMEWLGSAENISIDLSPATKTQTKIKKTIEHNIEVERSGFIKPRDGEREEYGGN